MPRCLLVIESVIRYTPGAGTVVRPLLNREDVPKTNAFRVQLRTPRGSTREVTASADYPRCPPVSGVPDAHLFLVAIPDDVPLGTEVWTVDG